MNTGVYKIENLTNGKIYIGSTATLGFLKRWRIHRNHLRANTHINQHLQNSWNKYGEQQFKFHIVEECIPSKCLIREQHYIDTLHPDYNIHTIAGSALGYRHTPITKILIGNASRGSNNAAYSGEHTFYHPTHGYFNGSIVQFGKTFNLRKSLPYKLSEGILSKSHGWIYVGKSTDKLPENINEFYRSRRYNDKPPYEFHYIDGTTFCGTMAEFVNKYNLDRSTIVKLIKGKRKYAFGWIIKT